GPSGWRRAATVVLAARWPRASPAAPPLAAAADGFRLLLLQRAPNQRFMPGAHVFPGGVLDAADGSADWLPLFAPLHGPPRFGLGPAPPSSPSSSSSPFPGLPGDAGAGPATALPDDVALRICAVREAFEEAGVLLLRPRAPPGLAHALPPPPGLAEWRARVRADPRCFRQLCERLDCAPDIWALRGWGGWLTPAPPRHGARRRFDTAFLLCCLRHAPPVEPDRTEVVGYKVGAARPGPQGRHARRGSALARGDARRDSVLARGDAHELYRKDSHFLENPMSTDRKTEEILKEGRVVNRVVIHSSHLYEIHVSLLSEGKHVYPKSYVVRKSPTAHL
uniref:Acyl-coenzyme A diphosphatase NUDT19 n=1 Tax=Cricetulus griseus TaxID=10029 RepID=A0A8C2QJN3_CRIGR